jgi:replication-associated recombination protein RarA
MKIMKSIDKKVGDKTYYKYKINIPKKVEETNLLDKELKINIEQEKITIEKDLKERKNKKS